jgi:hypothetical protein
MKRLAAILPLLVSAANAQCVMCFRTAAAQQMERARVLNIGIIVMLIPPVLILAGFLLLCWRRNLAYADSPAVPHDKITDCETPYSLAADHSYVCDGPASE